MAKVHTPKTGVDAKTAPYVYNDEEYTAVTDGSGRTVLLVPTAYGLAQGRQIIHT